MILNKIPYGDSLIVEAVNHQINYASTSNPTENSSFDVSKTGYTPIGIVGWTALGSLSSFMYFSQIMISGNSCVYNVRNTAGVSSVTQNTMTVFVLYKKS